MSAIRAHGIGRLPIFLLAASFVVALGSRTPCVAMRGGVGGGHAGTPGGSAHQGMPRGPLASRPFDHPFSRNGFPHGRRDRRGFSHSFVNGVPYGDWYWYGDDYGYGAPQPPQQRRGYQHSGYCDVSSHTFPQDCVWKEGP